MPVTGRSYELVFDRIAFGDEREPVLKRVRIDGAMPDDWFDLARQKPLERELRTFPVKAFRLLA